MSRASSWSSEPSNQTLRSVINVRSDPNSSTRDSLIPEYWQQLTRYCEAPGTYPERRRSRFSLAMQSSVEGSGGSKAAIA